MAFIWGGIFGFFAPFVGLFVGLQVSPIVANVFMFPIIGLSMILGTPFGMWGMGLKLVALGLSIIAWASIFGIVHALVKRG